MLSVFFFRDRKIQGECCSEMYCNNEMLPEPTPEPEVGTSAASSGYFNKNYFALLYLIIYMMF